MFLQNLKYVALPVPEITGGTQKIGQLLDTPTLPFLQNFYWAFIRIGPVNIPPNLKSVALRVPEIIGGDSKNLSSPWIRPRCIFSSILNGLLLGLAL